MVCPNCGTSVSDDAVICPACRQDLGRTVKIPKQETTWCPACGSLIPLGSEVCPSCGTPSPASSEDAGDAPAATRAEAGPADDTNAMPRIESAIPSGPEAGESDVRRDRAPRTRAIVVASLAALLVVGGGVLYITHPWNPGANDQRAKVDADTSMAGYPGLVTQLKGQDTSAKDKAEIKSGDQVTFEALQSYYKDLASLAERVDQSENSLISEGVTGSFEARKKDKDAADQLTLDVSNRISKIQDLDVTSGTYVDQKQTQVTLGNYLRNRMDAVHGAWEKSVSYEQDDASAFKDEILDEVGGESRTVTQSYKALFDKLYTESAPVQK